MPPAKSRELAPVGAELVRHHQAGDHAHAEVDGEDLRPEVIQVAYRPVARCAATGLRAPPGKLARPMVRPGKTMWNDTVKPNWMRASSSASMSAVHCAARCPRRRKRLCVVGPLPKFKVRSSFRSCLARERRGARAHAGVPEIAASPHRPRACRASASLGRRIRRTADTGKAMGGPRAQCIGAAEQRRLWVGACTHALRELTHRVCSSATNAVSEASYAVRPKAEERRAPVAQRRAILCAAPAARPSPCKHARWRERIADARKQPPWAASEDSCWEAFHPSAASRAARCAA